MADNKMSIYKKLLEVQTNLVAPKDKRNDFGRYDYRNAETILKKLRQYMYDYKFVVMMQDEIVSINDRYYVKAIAKMIDVETGDSIETYALARESETKKGMDSAQVSGATSSYARKYALCALFAIDDGEDNDSPEYQEKLKKAEEETKKEELKELEKHRAAFDKYLTSISVDRKWVEKTFGMKRSIESLNLTEFIEMTKTVKEFVENEKKKAKEKKK